MSSGTVVSIDGPVISTGELARQRELFEGVLGLSCIADEVLAERDVLALFGIHDHRARAVLLETPATRIGVWLVEFEPASDTVIRVGGVGSATDALKVLDFFTTDLAAAVDRFRACGFEVVSEGAPIALPDGSRFVEAHVKGPDGVMLAAISPLNRNLQEYVAITDGLFSELQSVSAPVTEFEPVSHFYETVLGIPLGLHFEFESPGFSKMVGTAGTTRIRANNYGRVIGDVMFGITHYGGQSGAEGSLRERARPPHRGLVAMRLSVHGLDALLERCRAAGAPIVVPAHETQTAAFARARAATVRGPHGVRHLLVESHATMPTLDSG